MKKLLYLIIATFLMGCSDWLDVQPSDRVAEETAFTSLAGFKMALNGVYVDLNDDALYGKALTCEMVEILAQRYAVNPGNKDWSALTAYDYGGSYVKARVEQTWQRAYSLIANTNLILKNCEEHREVLPDDYYRMIKGEALALRAFLHFDMYRLFGPIYEKDSALVSIPYYSEFALSVAPSLPGTMFMENVFSDLREAKSLLSDDPIITNGVKGDASDKFKQWRNLRLNYYAVQGLMARAYMYTGQQDSALLYAQNVIDVHERIFPWVDRTKATMGLEPDKVFSSELMFALENRNIGTLYSSLFDGEALKGESLLPLLEDNISMLKFPEGERDVRVASFLTKRVTIGGVAYRLFNKFEGPSSTDSLHVHLMPMIRLSEMYLIASEVLVNQGKARDAAVYFDEYRESRGLQKEGPAYVAYRLPAEWWKEFIGEGQLFFYYKRMMKTEIDSGSEFFGTVNVKLQNYTLPIPEGETKYN